jgi:hypothetical protein
MTVIGADKPMEWEKGRWPNSRGMGEETVVCWEDLRVAESAAIRSSLKIE